MRDRRSRGAAAISKLPRLSPIPYLGDLPTSCPTGVPRKHQFLKQVRRAKALTQASKFFGKVVPSITRYTRARARGSVYFFQRIIIVASSFLAARPRIWRGIIRRIINRIPIIALCTRCNCVPIRRSVALSEGVQVPALLEQRRNTHFAYEVKTKLPRLRSNTTTSGM